MLKVLGIGDNVCDIYVDSNCMYPGGQALNFAVYANQLGVNSSYLGVFGKDEIAEHILNTLVDLGIPYDFSRHYNGENGYAKVKLLNGDRIFLGSNKGGVLRHHPIILNDDDLSYIRNFDLIHTSNNSYFNGELEKVYQLGIPISYDFSNKWNDECLTESICKYISYGFLSCNTESEEEIVKICKVLSSRGCKIVIATMGSKGALLYVDGMSIFQKPKLIKAIDALGAGDSFATGFLLHVVALKKLHPQKMKLNHSFRKKILKEGLERGADIAAKNCMIKGAFGYGKQLSCSAEI